MGIFTNGSVAVYSFLFSCASFHLFFLTSNWTLYRDRIRDSWVFLFCLIAFADLVLVCLVFKRRGYMFKVALRACLLGIGFGFGTLIPFLCHSSWTVFGIYFALLSFFHFSEYVTVSFINPKSLSIDSFMLNHSREYHLAAILSWLEFLVERHYFPGMKQFWLLSLVGFCLCISGEFIRKFAMFTAGSNFNHVIQSYREEGHILVTSGIYSIYRHPSYVGWLYWSVGTQILLVNPICIVGYAAATWTFFKTRIEEEEKLLLNFFGEDYATYQRTVKTGIPFITGYTRNY